jgi:hypothetical protein
MVQKLDKIVGKVKYTPRKLNFNNINSLHRN